MAPAHVILFFSLDHLMQAGEIEASRGQSHRHIPTYRPTELTLFSLQVDFLKTRWNEPFQPLY